MRTLKAIFHSPPFSEIHECYCLALFMCPPLSSAEPLVTGKYVFLLFSGSVPSPNMCICVYVYYIRCSCCCLYFVLCCAEKKRRSRDESRHHGKGRTDEISVLSLLSSYLRWEVSKEGQLSYPNFVRGLLFDDIQPLIGRFEILGTLCCTICKSRDAPEVKRKQGYVIREIR